MKRCNPTWLLCAPLALGCPNGPGEDGDDDGGQPLDVEVAAVEGGVILSG